MPPSRVARRGTTARGGRNARRGRNERANDKGSQHGGNLENQNDRREQNVEQPRLQPPPTTLLTDFVAALTVHMAQAPRANTSNYAMEVVREFCKLNPPMFDGVSSDPLVADHWLSEICKLFDVLDVTEDAVRVKLVVCQLSGEANEWWKSVLATRKASRGLARTMGNVNKPDVENMTWAKFEAIFEDQYFLESFKDMLWEQFERFVQRGGTRSESGSVQQSRPSSSSGRPPQRGAHTQSHYRQTTSGQGSQVDRGASFSMPVQATQGRVFAVTAATPPPPPTSQTPESSVVQGMFLLFNSFSKVLFDSRASHSFIATSFVLTLGLKTKEFSPPLFVNTPVGW
ncbi:hypothetical protein Acr_00g0100530 [Actinidia rufa]|uniref:Retrotransposon gag domain-containing protein n=1 Tax=Actinidia rufa TaxID=165716 RepID=A0A7J0E024_9ERIC|nr:hypothetical protein Acr_00g0100530 [Actinidia rufa]